MPAQRPPFIYTPPADPPGILYHDDDIVVIDKPSGLLSVPGKDPAHHDCAQSRVKAQFPDARIVHRLDMDTSGVMVLARNAAAHRELSRQFENRETQKTYIAHIWGQPCADDGMVDLPLICDWPNRPLQKVDHEHGKPSQTYWRVIQRSGDYSVVELRPVTGRSHQLRVHMMELGHPILGDKFYAHEDALKAADRLMLGAQSLSFTHPKTGKAVSFESRYTLPGLLSLST